VGRSELPHGFAPLGETFLVGEMLELPMHRIWSGWPLEQAGTIATVLLA